MPGFFAAAAHNLLTDALNASCVLAADALSSFAPLGMILLMLHCALDDAAG